MEIAFVGTGVMGAPMTRHLLAAGHGVRAYNRTRAKADPLGAHGAVLADDVASALAGADVLVTMLLDAEATEAALAGALDGARPGMLWWQAATVGIVGTERLAALAARHGLRFVDAPVLGTKEPAEAGTLTILASGPATALDALEPVFGPTAAKVMRCGAAGAGSRLKLVANHWVQVLVEGTAETVQLAEALGVDPAQWLAAIAGGPLDAGYARSKGQAMIDRAFPPSFGLDNAAKDTRLILEAADRHGLELGIAPVVRDRFARASAQGHGEEDMAAVYHATGGGDR